MAGHYVFEQQGDGVKNNSEDNAVEQLSFRIENQTSVLTGNNRRNIVHLRMTAAGELLEEYSTPDPGPNLRVASYARCSR